MEHGKPSGANHGLNKDVRTQNLAHSGVGTIGENFTLSGEPRGNVSSNSITIMVDLTWQVDTIPTPINLCSIPIMSTRMLVTSEEPQR